MKLHTTFLLIICLGLTACNAPRVTLPPTYTSAPRGITNTPEASGARLPATLALPPVSTFTPSAPTTPVPSQTLVVPPAATRTETPSATPLPVLTQLTQGGCCVQPFWSPDGGEVWFIDRPVNSPVGIWGVPLTGGEPHLITTRTGFLSPDAQLVAYPEGGFTWIERLATGERWRTQANGRAILFAPDSSRIAWQVASSQINFDSRLVEIWVSDIDGANARKVASLIGGALLSWLPDSQRLLVSGRETFDLDPMVGTVDIQAQTITASLRRTNVRGVSLSPQGNWLVYQVAFSGDAAQDGLWAMRADGSEQKHLPGFGAFRWRDDEHILLIPLEPNTPMRVVEINIASGQDRVLTKSKTISLRIANGDWSLSPDGHTLAFVAQDDHNIWLLHLP